MSSLLIPLPYLLHSVDSFLQFLSRNTAGDDLQRDPILPDKEAGGDAHHGVFTQGGGGVKEQAPRH